MDSNLFSCLQTCLQDFPRTAPCRPRTGGWPGPSDPTGVGARPDSTFPVRLPNNLGLKGDSGRPRPVQARLSVVIHTHTVESGRAHAVESGRATRGYPVESGRTYK